MKEALESIRSTTGQSFAQIVIETLEAPLEEIARVREATRRETIREFAIHTPCPLCGEAVSLNDPEELRYVQQLYVKDIGGGATCERCAEMASRSRRRFSW